MKPDNYSMRPYPRTKADKIMTKIMDVLSLCLKWILIVFGGMEVIFQIIRFYFFRG